MFASLYHSLTAVMRPVFFRVLNARMKKGKEDAERLGERMGMAGRLRPDGNLIWFHGASVGESLSALPLIEKIQTEMPDVHILVTTGTVTSAGLMEKRLSGNAFHQFIPVDHPDWVNKFLDHWCPSAVIWLESDFWPNMLRAIKRREIPAILLNARMGQKSFKRWFLFAPGWLRGLLNGFDMCLTQSDDEKKRLDAFGHDDVRVVDNLKYASAKLPVDADKKETLISSIGGRKIWQYASTHPGEEDIAIKLHQKLRTKNPDLLTVIIPRHPARGADIQNLITSAGLKSARRSQNQIISGDVDIYVADTLGEMGLFFDVIDTTVIGGSFVAHGGHNPIEPAQFGNAVVYGPHMFNFKLICHDFETAGAALPLSDDEELGKTLDLFLNDKGNKQALQAAALKLTQDKSKALSNLWGVIGPWLEGALQHKGQK